MITKFDFKKEVTNWSEKLELEPKEIHIRKMNKKWASCSSKGRLTFSFSLLDESYEKRAKAIVHELLHLRYPEHNKMFNRLLSAYLSQENIESSEVFL